MNLLKPFGLLVSILTLIGCATPFQPDTDTNPYNQLLGGYSDERIDQNTAIVNFNGDRYTTIKTANIYVRFRAGQVTIANGYDYFIVTSTTLSPTNVDVQTADTYSYTTNPPKDYPANVRSVNYRGYKTSTSHSYQRRVNPNCKSYMGPYGVSIVIKMFSGQIPPGVPNAYYARDVIAHLGPSTF